MEAAGQLAHEEEPDSDSDDEEFDEIPEHIRMNHVTSRPRTSVSAEAYGQWNQKVAFLPPRHEKTEEQMLRLSATLSRSFLFQGLEKPDMDALLMAMREEVFQAEQWVFNEGDDGDFLFVIESGTVDCVKVLGGEATIVKRCTSGDVFGELALMYNCPRAAGILARELSVCWKLDRETFNNIVRDAAMIRRNRYDFFLQSVPLLQALGPTERSQIVDTFSVESYRMGETLIRQGDPGETFYIVEEGELVAIKDDIPVLSYNPGDFFGELALLNNQPRAASVCVRSDSCKVLSMTRAVFTKMLGPLSSLLERHSTNYL